MHSYLYLMDILKNGHEFDAGWHHDSIDRAHEEIHGLELKKDVCSVENWVWIDIDVTEEKWSQVIRGDQNCLLPAFLFSSSVIHDEAGRFIKGSYVRTSLLQAFHEGYIFETKNTVYCLIGTGKRCSVSLKEADYIFHLGSLEGNPLFLTGTKNRN